MAGTTIKEKIAAGARIIDVRTPAEFKDEAYPGAINIPLAILPARMHELEPARRRSCSIAPRAHAAVRRCGFSSRTGSPTWSTPAGSTTCPAEARDGRRRA